VSLQRIKAAFEVAMRNVAAPERELRWSAMFGELVADAGGQTLHVHVPTKARDFELERRQGELFESCREGGMSIRQIAAATRCPRARVHRHLSQSRTVFGTAA
jgi:hypothetical protein